MSRMGQLYLQLCNFAEEIGEILDHKYDLHHSHIYALKMLERGDITLKDDLLTAADKVYVDICSGRLDTAYERMREQYS